MRALHATAHGLAAPAFVAGPLSRRRPVAVLAGIGLALPLLVVLGLLLASADAVFADFFSWWGSPETVIVHAVLLGVGAWGMAGLLRLSSADPAPAAPRLPYRLGHVEATVVVGSLVALFTAFAVAQLIAVAGGAGHVLETAGLTYAEYARQGFFQLLAVAAITLVALVGPAGGHRPLRPGPPAAVHRPGRGRHRPDPRHPRRRPAPARPVHPGLRADDAPPLQPGVHPVDRHRARARRRRPRRRRCRSGVVHRRRPRGRSGACCWGSTP